MDDSEAWEAFPNKRKWFNKLWLSSKLGYDCGPCGVAPTKSAYYVVRPIYNISGMGAGARVQWIESNDYTRVEPGYFWCEYFNGSQYSVTYENRNSKWEPINSWKAFRNVKSLSKFDAWVRTDYSPELPSLFNDLFEIKRINVEFIEDKPIETHLRDSPDPNYDILIPVWEDFEEKEIDKLIQMGYTYLESYDDADGFVKPARLGFLVK